VAKPNTDQIVKKEDLQTAELHAPENIPVDLKFTDAVHQLNRSSVNILKIAIVLIVLLAALYLSWP
jgi:hypothetical protein